MVKSRGQSRAYVETLIIMVTALVGFGVFYLISQASHHNVIEKNLRVHQKAAANPLEQVAGSGQMQVVIQQLQSKMSEDPYYKKASSQKKQAVNAALHSYTAKYNGSSKTNKNKMISQAQGLMNRYDTSSHEERRRLVEDARRHLQRMNG